MFNEQEKILNSLKTDYDTITIPENIDDFIKKGMVKYPGKNKLYLYFKYSSIAAAITLFILAATIRISPVFADYLQDVPVLKYIVKLVNYDKGLKSAIENNFLQNIGLSDEHGNIKLTIDSIIIDEARMILFYTIENNSDYKTIYMDKVLFKDEADNGLPISCSYGFMYDKAKEQKIQDKINVSFTEGMTIPDVIHLEMGLLERDNINNEDPKELPYTWKIDIPVDKSKFEYLKQVYNINQIIEIEGQKISINRATIYPTRIAVDLSFADDNTMKLFSFEDIRIVNEKGKVLPTITDDVFASRFNDDHMILYFESDYFGNPENLYLHVSNVRALAKDKANVIVDIDKIQLLKAPDERLVLRDIAKSSQETTISFLLNGDNFASNQVRYSISASGVYDKNGKELKVTSSSYSERDDVGDFNQEISITIENTDYENPITIMLSDYPSRIKGDFKIKLK